MTVRGSTSRTSSDPYTLKGVPPKSDHGYPEISGQWLHSGLHFGVSGSGSRDHAPGLENVPDAIKLDQTRPSSLKI